MASSYTEMISEAAAEITKPEKEPETFKASKTDDVCGVEVENVTCQRSILIGV